MEDHTIELFTLEELVDACGKLKNKKAPGMDNIPSDILKILIMVEPDVFLKVFNKCLQEGTFPAI